MVTAHRHRQAPLTNSLLFRQRLPGCTEGTDSFTAQHPEVAAKPPKERSLLPGVDVEFVQSQSRTDTRLPPRQFSAVVAGGAACRQPVGMILSVKTAPGGQTVASIVVRGYFWFTPIHSRYGGSAVPTPQDKTHGGRQRASVVKRIGECRLTDALLARKKPPAFASPFTPGDEGCPPRGEGRQALTGGRIWRD